MSEIIPVRIQRSRKHKQVSPNGLSIVYCGRPGRWGNPFKVKGENSYWVIWVVVNESDELMATFTKKEDAIDYAILSFEQYSKGIDFSELKGKNLSCWCPLNSKCHVDIILKFANL